MLIRLIKCFLMALATPFYIIALFWGILVDLPLGIIMYILKGHDILDYTFMTIEKFIELFMDITDQLDKKGE